jgi:hypothetical protein
MYFLIAGISAALCDGISDVAVAATVCIRL